MRHLNHFGIFVLVLFSGWINTYCQVEAVIKGKVINETGIPIKGASIKLGSSDSRTNSSGFFISKTTDFPAQLTVTHPLYAEYTDMIALPERWKDTIRVVVVLTRKEKELEEITISAEQVFWVYPRKQANVLDFLLLQDDQILLCCSDEHHYFVRRVDTQGEKTNETPIRNHPRKLYRDCMEAIHLIYSDSIYETAMVNNSIGIFAPKPVNGIYNLLKSCVYKDNKTLIKYSYSKEEQRIKYTAINLQNKLSRTIYVGEDRTRNRELAEYAQENQNAEDLLFHTTTPPPPPSTTAPPPDHIKDSPGNFGNLKAARDRWNHKKFYDLVLTTPVYIPMFEVNDSLIVFDHLNDSATVFTKSGHRVRSFSIAYHYFKGWKKELITNLEKTKIYARYQLSDGLTILREINPTNGKTERVIRLEKHVFPEHLQIHGDFIYYIYKDYLDQSMHYIFKQHLE